MLAHDVTDKHMAKQTIENLVNSLKKQSERHVTSWLWQQNSDEIQKQHKEKRKVKIQTAVARVKAKQHSDVKKVLLLRHPMMCLQTEPVAVRRNFFSNMVSLDGAHRSRSSVGTHPRFFPLAESEINFEERRPLSDERSYG